MMQLGDLIHNASRAIGGGFRPNPRGSHGMMVANQMLSIAADATAIFLSVITLGKIIQSIKNGGNSDIPGKKR